MTMKSEQKTKVSQENYGKNDGENTSHHPEIQRTQKQAQPSPWDTIPWEHQHTIRNCKSLSMIPTYRKSPQYREP